MDPKHILKLWIGWMRRSQAVSLYTYELKELESTLFLCTWDKWARANPFPYTPMSCKSQCQTVSFILVEVAKPSSLKYIKLKESLLRLWMGWKSQSQSVFYILVEMARTNPFPIYELNEQGQSVSYILVEGARTNPFPIYELNPIPRYELKKLEPICFLHISWSSQVI